MIWLIGNKGMLGSEIARQLELNNIKFIGSDRDVDITNFDALDNFAKEYQNSNNNISWIINCSGYTAVDKAEEDQELANLLNNIGPENIAKVAKKYHAKMIHISTDYVYDGSGTIPYTEDMKQSPLGVYGVTKADGEKSASKVLEELYILRTAWLYGFNGKNFVYTMLKLMNIKEQINVVNDQIGTPTFAGDLAGVIVKIISLNNVPYGSYNCTNLGQISWYEFACSIYNLGKEFNKIENNTCIVKPCTTAEYPSKTLRPAYSVLSKDKIQKTLNITLPNWQNSLKEFISSPLFNIDFIK